MSHSCHNADSLGCELAGEVVRKFGRVRIRVTGTSMIPAVWPGDVVVVERREVAGMGRGEIAVALREEGLVAHRVVSAGDSTDEKCDGAAKNLITRGDALLRPDAPLREEELLGAVIAIERGHGTIEPQRELGFAGQLLAALAQRSNFAANLLVRLHVKFSAPAERAALCQN